MRKTLAYFLSIIILFTLGLVILHPSFLALADWLGPLLGSHIYTVFMLIYLLLADPLRYLAVTITWIIVGLLIGVISGKKLGASITALLVWLTTLPILAASFAGIYFNLDARGIFSQESLEALKLIPIIPEQLNFNSLFQIPIFSDLVFQIVKLFSTMSETSNPQAILIDLVTPQLISVVAKPLLLIASAIVGAIISKTIFGSIGKILPNRKTAIALLIIGLISIPVAPASATLNLNDGIYAEIIGGYVEEQGRAIIGELLLGNQIENIPMDTPEAEDLIASIVFTQKIYDPSILYTLPIEGIRDYLHFRNLSPSTFAVNVYLGDDTETIKAKSNQVISTIEQNLGIQFREIFTMPMPNEGGPEAVFPTMTAALYYSQNTIDETTTNIIQGFKESGGFADFIDEKIKAGSPLDIELYATGFVLIEPFKAMLPLPSVPPEFQEEYNALIESRMSFLAGIQLARNAVEPMGNNYSFDLRDTLSVQSIPSYSPDSDGSFIIMARSNMTGISDPMDPTVHIRTSIPEDSMELTFLTYFLQEMGVIDIKGGLPTILDTQLILSEIILPEVTVTKTSQSTTDGSIEITVSANNNGDQTINDLILLDPFPEKYGILASGANEATWLSLNPGQSISLSYTLDPEKPGSYTDTPAILTYTIDDIHASTSSNTLQSIEKSPNPISMLMDNYQATTALLDMASNGNGQILTLALSAVILLVAVVDVFRFLRQRSKRDEQSLDELGSGLPLEESENNDEDPL